ncbi:MAG TPA: peptidoglycan bridge formation glycyltransferase FemA/FemB family protein [Patescibacteria group bacterium]|nr:peptidoglycan bridge formation glycyltransferase FemA/FemB family protein [Patescibacteria group bacterium]
MFGQKKTLFERFASRVDLHQSPMYAKAMESIGWKTVGTSPSQIFVKKLGPVAIAKMQRPSIADVEFLKKIRKQQRTIMFYLEPALACSNIAGFSRKTAPLAHSATSLIDLGLTEKQLLERMKQKTRYNIGLAERKKHIRIRVAPLETFSKKDLETLFKLRTAWNKRKNVYGYDKPFLQGIVSSFKNQGFCLFAEIGSNVVASLLILEWNKTAVYFCAYSTPKGNEEFAPTLLTWVAMKTSKKRGNDIFDFGGIFDARFPKIYNHWKGFTKFKEGFSAYPLFYLPSFVKYGWWT